MAYRGRGRHRASLGGLFSDILDSTHDYMDDWTDRFDDFEYDMRDAFDDVIDDRDYWYDRPYPRRRYAGPYDGPYRRPRAEGRGNGARGEELKKVLDEAGLKELSEKVEKLSKTVDQLAKAKESAAR